MTPRALAVWIFTGACALSCSGSQSTPQTPAAGSTPGHMSRETAALMNQHHDHMIAEVRAGSEDEFAPLEIGADYQTTMTKMNREPFVSPTHGRRWVNVYVNRIGLDAYRREADLPVGSIVVKESFEDVGGHPDLAQRGPTFLMERRAPGYATTRGDYWYAIHWANPVGAHSTMDNGQRLPPLYWRGRSARVQYCEDCHNAYDNRMGGVPRDNQSWSADGGTAAPAPH